MRLTFETSVLEVNIVGVGLEIIRWDMSVGVTKVTSIRCSQVTRRATRECSFIQTLVLTFILVHHFHFFRVLAQQFERGQRFKHIETVRAVAMDQLGWAEKEKCKNHWNLIAITIETNFVEMPSDAIVIDNLIGSSGVECFIEDASRFIVVHLERTECHTLRVCGARNAWLRYSSTRNEIESNTLGNLARSIFLTRSETFLQYSKWQVLAYNLRWKWKRNCRRTITNTRTNLQVRRK